MVNSSGLKCEVWVVHFKWIKGERGWIFIVEFVKVCEWFDRCDRLQIIFKSRKTKITKFSLILNMIKIIIINVWFVVEENINMYEWK